MQNLTAEEYKEHVGLSKDFDFDKLKPHKETAFRRKIFPYISEDIYEELKNSNDENKKRIADLITKAGANYTVVVSIPILKIKFSSFGIDKYTQEKMKSAEWWDVRDFGLSLIKIADEALSDAITEISRDSVLKSRCSFFSKYSFDPIPTPEEFNDIYSINKSMDVYLNLVPLMRRVWQFSILSKIKSCTVIEISENQDLIFLLKDVLVYSSLANAIDLSQFTFITSGLVIQYDELPWQKSLILSDDQKSKLAEEFRDISSNSLGSIVQYLKDHPEEFPCYQPEIVEGIRKIIEKKSGLYM